MPISLRLRKRTVIFIRSLIAFCCTMYLTPTCLDCSVHDEQKAAEVTQQTLTTFVQSIMTKCITMVKVKLQFAVSH